MSKSWWSKLFGENELPSPRGVPGPVGQYLVTALKKDPDWTWKLMAVVRPRHEEKGHYDVRVYDAAQAQGRQIEVRNFNSLDDHPELTLFEGWFDKNTNRVEVAEKIAAAS